MNTYRAKVTAHFHTGDITFETYVGAGTWQQARDKLVREGYTVHELWELLGTAPV